LLTGGGRNIPIGSIASTLHCKFVPFSTNPAVTSKYECHQESQVWVEYSPPRMAMTNNICPTAKYLWRRRRRRKGRSCEEI